MHTSDSEVTQLGSLRGDISSGKTSSANSSEGSLSERGHSSGSLSQGGGSLTNLEGVLGGNGQDVPPACHPPLKRSCTELGRPGGCSSTGPGLPSTLLDLKADEEMEPEQQGEAVRSQPIASLA